MFPIIVAIPKIPVIISDLTFVSLQLKYLILKIICRLNTDSRWTTTPPLHARCELHSIQYAKLRAY